MVVKLIFSVFDSAVEAFLPPFYCNTKGEALRMFMDACGKEGHQFRTHAKDYTLFHLGSFDEKTGRTDNNMAPDPMAVALDLVTSIPTA